MYCAVCIVSTTRHRPLHSCIQSLSSNSQNSIINQSNFQKFNHQSIKFPEFNHQPFHRRFSFTMDESKTEVDSQGQMQNMVLRFIAALGAAQTLPESCETADFYSELIRGLLKVRNISPGRVSCSFRVKRRIANAYNGLHGGAVAAIAERVATACARTLVSEEKPLFLGELSTSYLSSAPINAEVVVDGSVVRSGRNLTVVSVEFRLKDYGKLAYTAHATFFNAVPSKL